MCIYKNIEPCRISLERSITEKNDSRGKFAQQKALITNERVKQTEDEAERIHLTVGRMDTGYEIIASLPNRFTVMCPHCHGQNFYSYL